MSGGCPPLRTLHDVERDRSEMQAISAELDAILDGDTSATTTLLGNRLRAWMGRREHELRQERRALRWDDDPRAKRIADLELAVQRLSKAYEEVQTGYKPSNSASQIAAGFANQWGSTFSRWDGSIEFTVDVSTTGGMSGWRWRCLRPDGTVIVEDHARSLGAVDYVTSKTVVGHLVFTLAEDPHAYDGLEEEIAAAVDTASPKERAREQ